MPFFSTSAMTGDGVDDAFDSIVLGIKRVKVDGEDAGAGAIPALPSAAELQGLEEGSAKTRRCGC